MRELKFQNKKEKQEIYRILEDEFGFNKEFTFEIVINQKDKIYIINRDIERVDMNKVRINSIGLYFGEIQDHKIRLTIEGSQIVGPHATKNVLELEEKMANEWIKGFDIENKVPDGIYILKYKTDFIGCTKIKNNKMLNFVPKNRRLKTVNDE